MVLEVVFLNAFSSIGSRKEIKDSIVDLRY